MKKYLLIGDSHWSAYSSILRSRGNKYTLRLEKLIEAFNWVEDFGKENNCDGEIWLGDTLDRPDLGCEEITALQEVKWNNIPKTFLVGNHESNVLNLDFSSTKVFEKINSRIIDKPLSEDINDMVNFTYIPYLTTDQIKPISNFITGKNKKVVFAHQDLAGLQYGLYKSTSGFDINDIDRNCDMFINGHLHSGCKIGRNIFLVGNLTGQNFTEDASKYDHLIYILTVHDDGKLELESFEVPCSMNFYKIRIDSKNDFIKLDNLKNNALVSVVCSIKLATDVENYIKSKNNILERKITVYYGNYKGSSDKIDFTVEDHIKLFVDFIHENMENSSILEDELIRLQGGE